MRGGEERGVALAQRGPAKEYGRLRSLADALRLLGKGKGGWGREWNVCCVSVSLNERDGMGI